MKATAEGESHWQLFLDDDVIERSTGFRRVLHHPRPRGIVLPADKPWEAGLSIIYVGHRSNGLLECYYRVHGLAEEECGEFVGYATSEDGIHWEKPILKLVDCAAGAETNLVPCGQPVDLGRHGNVVDPERRFVIALGEGPGWRLDLYFGRELPDFVHDPDWRAKLVGAGRKPSYKLAVHFWDNGRREWVCMRQSSNHPPTRCIARWATKDLRTWTLKPVLYPDAADSSEPRCFHAPYGMRAVHAEGLVLGFIEWFKGDHTRPDLATLEQDGIGRVHMKGTMEARLAVSRDGGYTWDRTVSREAWIPHGTEQDSYDRMVLPYTGPLRMGTEDWFYYTVADGDHCAGYCRGRTARHQGALYVQKHNRYVSLTADATPQILITRPLEVTGKALRLNVDAGRGEVAVGIGIDKPIRAAADLPFGVLPNYMVCDREGRTHLEEGFRLEDCDPVRVDGIDHVVTFGGDPSIESLRGKTVRLYIRMTDADLYGFQFG